MTNLKRIKYRGGLVEFSIPAHWREEYEPAGGGTFYDDAPGSGTFRINVMTCQSQTEPSEQMARTVLKDGITTTTVEGFLLRREEKAVQEERVPLHMTTWMVAVPVPPQTLRIASFTYTIFSGQQDDPRFAAEIELLDQRVREALYSQAPGVAGEHRPT